MYRIHAAAQQAGLSAPLVRAWERRYALLAPQRTEAGYRLYSNDDVAVLRGAKTLVDQGRSISEVARVGRAELLRIGRSAPFDAGTTAASPPTSSTAFLDAAIDAVVALDGARLESLISHATRMGSMSGVEICDRVLLPMLREIGSRWEKGDLRVSAEHFGSSVVRRHLHLLVEEESRRNKGAPVVVCACPEDELHEGGLLGFALQAATLGWGIVYLGASTPVDEMIAAADRSHAGAIGVSMTMSQSRRDRAHMTVLLAAWKAKDAGRRLWFGGRASEAHRRELVAADVEVVDDAKMLPPVRLVARAG